MNKRTETSVQTLVGVVTPFAWDERDQVCEVSLSATDDQEYLIENSSQFFGVLQKPIQATGVITNGKKMHRMINIKRFKLIDTSSLFEHVYPEYSRAIAGPEFDPAEEKPYKHGSRKKGLHGRKDVGIFSTNA
jgi:hypothetical protein